MPHTKVVHLPKRHKLIQGDDMYAATYQFSKAIIHIDESYINNRTPEQEQADKEALDAAMWDIAEELYARGETA